MSLVITQEIENLRSKISSIGSSGFCTLLKQECLSSMVELFEKSVTQSNHCFLT